MLELVKKQLSHSAYSEICMTDLFGELLPKMPKFAFQKEKKKHRRAEAANVGTTAA